MKDGTVQSDLGGRCQGSDGHNDLPEGWIAVPLREVSQPSKEKAEPSGCPNAIYVGLEHIESGTNRIVATGVASDVESTKGVFHTGDVLYGKLRPYLNKVARPTFGGICSTDILVFPQTDSLDSRFLMYFLSLPEVVQFANDHSKGISLPRTSFQELGAVLMRLPPLAEQRRIVAKIEELLARVESAKARLARARAILNRFRQAVLAAACSGRLTEDWRAWRAGLERASIVPDRARTGAGPDTTLGRDPPDFTDVPETWGCTRIGQVATVCLGGTPPRARQSYWGGAIPWVSSGEVANCRISRTREQITAEGLAASNAKLYPRGTVLVAMIGEGRTRGQAAILDIEACTNQNVAGLVPREGIEAEFLWYWALAQYTRNRAVGRGGSQPALNGQKVRELVIAVPPLDEQHEIVRRTRRMLETLDACQRRCAAGQLRCERLSQAVLAKAFRGDLVPTEAELAQGRGKSLRGAGLAGADLQHRTALQTDEW